MGPRIGFNRCGGYGDGLVSTAVVKSIRKKYPDAEIIGYLKGSPYRIYRKNEDVTKIVEVVYMETPHRLKEDLIRERYKEWDMWYDLKPCPRLYVKPNYDGEKNNIIREWENRLQSIHNGYIISCRDLSQFNMNQLDFMFMVLDLPKSEMSFIEFPRIKNDYVTLCNEAWGEAPIKTWFPERWSQIVSYLSEIDIQVLQVGEFKDESIVGTINLTGKQNFDEACKIVSGSIFHLGIEGFWNHFCRALNIPAVILFGPTPKVWFSYPEHQNISGECGDCWWETGDWMLRCAEGHKLEKRPCMDSISTEIIMKSVVQFASNVV
jgi:ADP-heptose:LPS heptosyltransferase